MTIKLTLIPTTADRFDAVLPNGLVVAENTRQPRVDAARAMMDLGCDPGMLITTKHVSSQHVSFKPAPIGELAKWTFEESSRGGIRKRRWKPVAERWLHGGRRTSGARLQSPTLDCPC